MFEKLGKKKFAIPFVVPILLICLFALMFYPMANMELKHMPFAVVCLDEGAELPTGNVNVGEQMADALASGDASALAGSQDGEDGESASGLDVSEAIEWTVLSSEKELEEALVNNEYYGAIVIPKDFTLVNAAQQMKDQAADGVSEEDSTLHVYLDKAKSPLIAQRGIAADVQVVNDGGLESSGPAMGSMLS